MKERFASRATIPLHTQPRLLVDRNRLMVPSTKNLNFFAVHLSIEAIAHRIIVYQVKKAFKPTLKKKRKLVNRIRLGMRRWLETLLTNITTAF
jgi:hypothetical protein